MIPTSFEYKRAGSVEEALQMLGQAGDDGKLLAGGHSLLPAMKLRLNSPATLIDIGRIAELNYIRDEGDSIAIGAATTHGAIAASDLVAQHLAMMSQAAGMIGDVQVRNVGTIGGSIAHADPAADWPASLLAASAVIVMQGANGTRSVGASDFFLGLYDTALGEGEIITEIRLPKPPAGTKSAYVKFFQPASRFAIVGCAVMAKPGSGAVVAFTGVSDVAFRDTAVENELAGKALSADNIEAAAALAAEGVDIMGDHFAGDAYRKHLAKVYCKRALMAISDQS